MVFFERGELYCQVSNYQRYEKDCQRVWTPIGMAMKIVKSFPDHDFINSRIMPMDTKITNLTTKKFQ